jgi:DNA-binding LytR/AlgR family response regulator
VRQYLQQANPSGALPKLWGQRENENWALVDYQDILWVVAEAKKVNVQTTAGEKLLVRHTLKELEPRLAGHNIVPVHKGYLVNLDHVAEIVPWFSGTFVIRMADAQHTQIPMSRRYAAQLKKRTDWG